MVFSRALNENVEVAALEGTYASVIGGAPAAAVVFAGEVEARARKDARLQSLNQAIALADGAEKGRLRSQWDELFKLVHSEQLGEMASEFDRVHSVQRALDVGALNCIIPPDKLRPYLIDAVERGIAREEGLHSGKHQDGKARVEVAAAFAARGFLMEVYWLEQTEADLPTADDWLSPNEQALLNIMRFAKRRSDWRLGRWTAKNALALYFLYLKLPADSQVLAKLEIRSASTGAPEAYFGNHPATATISLSHRAGIAACAVTMSERGIGLRSGNGRTA